MGTEFKGRAWFGKIYNKLETILVEVDTFTSQNTLCLKSSDPSEWESVRSEAEEVAEEGFSETCDLRNEHDRVALPSCESPSDPPSVQNFDDSGYVRVEERVQEDSLEENSSASSLLPDGEGLSGTPLLQEYCDGNLTSATTLGDEEPVVTDQDTQITDTVTPRTGDHSVFPGEESVEEDRAESFRDDVSMESQSTQSSVESFETVVDSESTDDSNLNSIATKILDIHMQNNVANMVSSNHGNVDDVMNGKSDVSPLDSIPFHDMEVREEILPGTPLLQEYCDGDLTSATTLGDEEPVITDQETQITETVTPQTGDHSVFPREETVEEDRAESFMDDVSVESQSTQSSVESFETVVDSESTDDSNLNSIASKILDIHIQKFVANMGSSNHGNVDDVINGKSDVSPLDSIALHDMEVREEPPFVDDNALYALRLRTKKLRSFKRKVLDALTTKKRREKEYEHLSIWFGDADMGSDLVTGEDSKQSEAKDNKSSQVHEPEDTQWELL